MSKKKTEKKKDTTRKTDRKTELFFVLNSGDKEFKITGEKGKFYVCEDGRTFRKMSKLGSVKVVEVEDAPQKAQDETETCEEIQNVETVVEEGSDEQ